MIVDDEPFIHQLYKDILEFKGFEIVGEAYDGEEAVDVFNAMEEKPDVIIMDHRMPNRDGIEATMKILGTFPKARIIFASADLTIRERALDVGAVGFLAKPFEINDLVIFLDGVDQGGLNR